MEDNWNPIESLIANARIHDHNERVVAEFIGMYFKLMHELELRHEPVRKMSSDAPDWKERFDQAIEEQKEVHSEFWDSTDENWHPCSIGYPHEFCIEDVDDMSVSTDGRGNFLITLTRSKTGLSKKTGYLVETCEGKPRIINKFY